MTKQIREGIEAILLDNSMKGRLCQRNFTELAEDIMKMESELGVVLKVERKLPLISEADVKEWNEATIDGIKTCQRFMVKAGYVATKPLIDAVSSPPTFRDGSALAFAEPLVCCPSCKKLPCRCPSIGSLYVEEG